MAQMQDEIDLDINEIEAVEQEIAKPQPKEDLPELPDKLKGKSLKEIADIYLEAEKTIGRQAQEVGEVRKLADELIKSQLHKKPEPEQIKEIDFFENPEEAVRQAVNSNPKVLAAEQYAAIAQRELARQKIAQLHPDYLEVVGSDDYGNWIKASAIRSQLHAQAANYNVDAANELLSTFKELKAVKARKDTELVTEIDMKSRDKSLRAASVDTGGTGESYKKVYRRSDLIRLKLTNPEKFRSMQDDIDLAYQEGRVR